MLAPQLFRVCLLLIIPLFLQAGGPVNPYIDPSVGDNDGPYVFYRNNQIMVKTVVRRDTVLGTRTQVFGSKKAVKLTCNVAQTGASFSFSLRDSFSVQTEVYDMPARLIVLSDIEGNFEAFQMMLQGVGIVDDQFNWSFGNGHLVLLGDFFDRGLNVTECLWLIYKLEAEADAAGGKVHFILGNHEVLNLAGQTEYVRKKYLDNARVLSEDYGRLYAIDTELGRWLRTKNAVEKIGDYVFCHGGISPQLVQTKLTLPDINRIARLYLGKKEDKIENPQARAVFDHHTGIFWYREAAKNRLTPDALDQILAFAGVQCMVIGHTLVADILNLYDGKVICVDLYHEEYLSKGYIKCLFIENGTPYGLNSKGEKNSLQTIHMPFADKH